MNYLNPIKTTVFMDGKPCPFTTLRLEQEYSGHHTFDIGILCSPLRNGSIWHHEREGIIAQQGQKVSIRMQHTISGDETIFRGIITGVKMEADEGTAGMLHYTGHSPTILLDSGKTMDSFTNYTLEEVVREVVRNYGNGIEAVIAPKFPGQIPYLQMQQESGFEFLKRIAYQYGEWFYYDGQKLYFGNPYREKDETLTYDVDLRDISYGSRLRPFNYSRFEYLPEYDCEIIQDDNRRMNGINTYLHEAIAASNTVFNSYTTLYNETVNNSSIHLSKFLEIEKGRDIAGMSVVEGRSNTCRVRVAQPVVIKIPESMCTRCDLGRYRVMSVVHRIDSSGIYSNTFKGVPAGMDHLPVHDVRLPKAYPILGKVVANDDPQNMGRVQVQFPWQEERRKSTGWIRVLSPDAGKSEAFSGHRGFVFIPEIGDQVLVAFEGDNPGRPYVQGSLFRGKSGKEVRHIKAIRTDSGHILEFNDDTDGNWGITLKDRNGCTLHFDTKGKNIEVSAPETMTLNAKNIRLNAQEDINIVADGKLDVNVGQEGELKFDKLKVDVNNSLDVLSKEYRNESDEVLVASQGELTLDGKKNSMLGGKKVEIQASQNNLIFP